MKDEDVPASENASRGHAQAGVPSDAAAPQQGEVVSSCETASHSTDGHGNVPQQPSSNTGRDGQVRGRGRGRKAVPRAVPRKKPPTRVISTSDGASSNSDIRGRGARRGRDEPRGGRGAGTRGRGRGGYLNAEPKYEPDVIGLGQIAPRRVPVSTLSQGSGNSRRSSGVGTQSSTGGQSASSRQSLGSLDTLESGAGSSSGPGICEINNGSSLQTSANGFAAPSACFDVDSMAQQSLGGSMAFGSTSKVSSHAAGEDSDTDDDLPDDDVWKKNHGIANYVGTVVEGLLPPVSVPSISNLPTAPPRTGFVSERGYDDGRLEDDEVVDDSDTWTTVKPTRNADAHAGISTRGRIKPEPMEVSVSSRTIQGTNYSRSGSSRARPELDPLLFPAHSDARYLLSSKATPVFVQLPGLLPLNENRSAWPSDDAAAGAEKAAKEESPSDAASNTRDSRALGTDLCRVGRPGYTERIGKVRLYKSGRVEMVFDDGTTYDVESGADCRSAQQLVCVKTGGNEENTCDELCSSLMSRLICCPSHSSLSSDWQRAKSE